MSGAPDRKRSRRTALRVGGVAVLGGLSGCLTLLDRYRERGAGGRTATGAARTDTPTGKRTETEADAEPETATATPEPLDGAWPMFQFDARNTGFQPSRPDAGGTPSLAAGRSADWVYPTGEPGVSSGPVVGTDAVHVASGGRSSTIYALDAATGEARWTVEPDVEGFMNSPAVVEGVVYVGSLDATLWALDAATGESLWERELGLRGTSPTVAGDLLFVSASGLLHALDRRTGEQRWRFQRFDDSLAGSTPAVTGDAVYHVATADSDESRLVAVDRESRSRRWESGERRRVLPMVAPAVGGELVYVADGINGPSLVAFDAATGETVWEADHARAGLFASPALADGTLYAGSLDDSLYAVDAATGDLRWSFETGGGIVPAPAVAGGTVVVGSNDGAVYGVDAAAGERRWRFGTGFRVRSSPAVGDGTVYVGSDDGRFYALGAAE
jgi:outer membrane protein assembly factor BamB